MFAKECQHPISCFLIGDETNVRSIDKIAITMGFIKILLIKDVVIRIGKNPPTADKDFIVLVLAGFKGFKYIVVLYVRLIADYVKDKNLIGVT